MLLNTGLWKNEKLIFSLASKRGRFELDRECMGGIVKDSEFFRPRTSDEVSERARSIWNGYSGNPYYWRKLPYSMVTRLQHVIDNNGGWTKYFTRWDLPLVFLGYCSFTKRSSVKVKITLPHCLI